MRIEFFSKYCARYNMNKDLIAVIKYLEQEEGLKLNYKAKVPDDHQVEMFMRYFEELELLIRAKSIDEKIVYYMFIHYLFTFEKLKHKWKNVGYNSDNWKLFHDLMSRMKKIKEDKNIYKI